MSFRGFVAAFLGRQFKPSDALLRYVNGTGSGYELDSDTCGYYSEEVEREAIEPLLAINRQFITREYPLGISNPAAFQAIRDLAEELRTKGL
ncbi:MAG: hypothetical protein ACJ8E8_13110 [Sphingomicrobium sp.]